MKRHMPCYALHFTGPQCACNAATAWPIPELLLFKEFSVVIPSLDGRLEIPAFWQYFKPATVLLYDVMIGSCMSMELCMHAHSLR